MSDKKVIYYTVKEAQEKVRALIQTVDRHLHQKEKIQILAPDVKTIDFISNLLWSYPKESFRPHSITTPLPLQDLILLSLFSTPTTGFSILFNLSQDPIDPGSSFKIAYELEDVSFPQKAALFQKKFQLYQKSGAAISTGVLF